MSFGYRTGQPSQQRYQEDVLRELVLQKVAYGILIAGLASFFVVISGLGGIFALLAFVGEIIAIIGYFFAKKEATIEKLYYLFVVSSAILLGFTFQSLLTIPNGMEIIFTAFGTTSLIVGGIYYYTATRQPDVSNMVKYLFPLGLLFIVVMIGSIFITVGNTGNLIISILGALLFSAYLYYDLGRLMNNQVGSPARMAWSIYWDILLIFKFILRALIYSNRR